MSAPLQPRRVAVRIDSRLDHVQFAARAIKALCTEAGLEPRSCARVELAVVEAVNNVIRHAYRLEPGHEVEVVFVHQGAELHFEVNDAGTPREIRPPRPFEFDPADTPSLPEGGMGLHLIHAIMDHVEYRSAAGRNTLAMTKRMAA